MQKLCIFLTIVVVALGSALSLSVDYGIRKQADCKRLSSNQSALLEQAETFRVRDSLNGAGIRLLTMQRREFEAHFESLNALIRDMELRVKHIESVSQNATESRYDIETIVRDSLVVGSGGDGSGNGDGNGGNHERIAKTVQTIRYADPHLSLNGVIDEAIFTGSIVCRDTLTQIVHRIPRRFLFIRWGTKELRQEIVSSNPHTRIVYSQYIRITK